MKKILIFLGLTFVTVPLFAVMGDIWKSSYTATGDTTKSLCSDSSVGKRRGMLHSVCVDDGGPGSTISIYNAYSTAVNPVAVIFSTAAAGNCMTFDVDMSSGIVYTKSSGANVTFTYNCSN